MKNAVIYEENGTLIVKFTETSELRTNLYRDVTVEYVGTGDKIVVRGKRVNLQFEYSSSFGSFDLTDPKNIEKVLPEYVEDWKRPALDFMQRPVGDMFKRDGGEWAKERIVRRIRPGLFELKDTNHQKIIVSTKYIIYEN